MHANEVDVCVIDHLGRTLLDGKIGRVEVLELSIIELREHRFIVRQSSLFFKVVLVRHLVLVFCDFHVLVGICDGRVWRRVFFIDLGAQRVPRIMAGLW